MMGRLIPPSPPIGFLGYIPCPGDEPQPGPCGSLDLPGRVAQPGIFPLLFLFLFWQLLPGPPYQPHPTSCSLTPRDLLAFPRLPGACRSNPSLLG